MDNLKVNRNFGFLLSAIFLISSIILFDSGKLVLASAISIFAIVIFVSAIIQPYLFGRARLGWIKFGVTISYITNPIILGVIFFLILTPFGLVGRLFGRDPLMLGSQYKTMWVKRKFTSYEPSSFERQF